MPSWKKVIISGSDAALNSLDITQDLTVDTNTLYVDSSNNRVGIGTASPSQKLTVEGDITGSGYVKGSTLYALDDVVVGDQILHYGDTDTNLSFTTDKIQINAGGVEMITLTEGAADNVHINAGAVDMDFKVSTDNDNDTLFVEGSTDRVGIGTSSPGAKFHVSGGGFDVYTDYSATNASIGISSLKKTSGFSALVVGRSHSINDSLALRFNYVGANNASNYLGLGFYANDDLLVVKPSGNVGIGTTNPTYQLHVSSSTAALGVYERAGGAALYLEGQLTRGVMGTVGAHPLLIAYNSGEVARFTGTSFDVTGSLNVGTGTDINLIGGGNLETNGGNVNTTGGSINIGGGAVNGTIPGSAVNVDVVTATIKNFVIDHPTPEKEGYKLRHSSLEGPEAGVYFRGKSTSNIIDLPDYWVDLVEEESITVSLTPFSSPCQHYIEDIRDNQVIIGCACGTPNYHFTVYGERKDVEKLVVEYKEEKYL